MSTKTGRTNVHSYLQSRAWQIGLDEPGWDYHGLVQTSLENSVTHEGSVPDYRQRILRGQSATTYLSGVQHTHSLSNDTLASTTMGRDFGFAIVKGRFELRGNVSINMPGPSDPSLFTMTSVQNKTISQFLNRCTAAQTSLKGLVSAGEMGETARMVNRAGRAMFGKTDDYLRDLSKIARHLTPQNIMRTVSAKWLEYSFGIKPLVNDVVDGLNGLSRIRDFRPPRVRVTAQNQSMEKNPAMITEELFSRYLVRNVYEQRREYAYKLYGAVGIPNMGLGSFSNEFGFNSNEFVPTLYELIPFSFLADYFVNLGAIIDAYSFNRSMLLWVAEGHKRVSFVEASPPQVTSVIPDGWFKVDESISIGTPFKRSLVIKSRAPYTGPLVPELEFQIPGTSTKWVNMAALAAQHRSTSAELRRVARL